MSMKKSQLLIIAIVIILSCKNNTYNSKKQYQRTSKSQVDIDNATKKDTILNNDLEFFNDLSVLGKGLIKVNGKDNLTIIKNNEGSIENVYDPTITPIFFKPDYGIFYLVCVSEEKNNYEIQIDKESTAMLSKREGGINFLSWNDFLLSTTGISNLNWEKNPLKKKPGNESITLEVSEEDGFVVVKVSNEWIQVSNEEGQIGWIKWKQGNKLLIDAYLLM